METFLPHSSDELEIFIAGVMHALTDGLQHTFTNHLTGERIRIYLCADGDIVIGLEKYTRQEAHDEMARIIKGDK